MNQKSIILVYLSYIEPEQLIYRMFYANRLAVGVLLLLNSELTDLLQPLVLYTILEIFIKPIDKSIISIIIYLTTGWLAI
jgi:hypothetical protein